MKLLLWPVRQFLSLPAIKVFQIYWKLYGGARALATSPYIYLSIFLTAGLYRFWLKENQGERIWAQTSIDIIPSMLGFSMGGMAIMLAFSNTKIFLTVSEEGKPHSYFMKIIANFFHFIIIQSFSLILALFSKVYSNNILSAFGFFTLIYSITLGLAMAGQLLSTARIFNATASLLDKKSNE